MAPAHQLTMSDTPSLTSSDHGSDSSSSSSTSENFRQAVVKLIDSKLTTQKLHETAIGHLTVLRGHPKHNVPEWLSKLLGSGRNQGKEFTLEGLLQQMYSHAPSEHAQRYVASAVCSCNHELENDSDGQEQLAIKLEDLATTWMAYLFWPCQSCSFFFSFQRVGSI